jgi:hypothetical protein
MSRRSKTNPLYVILVTIFSMLLVGTLFFVLSQEVESVGPDGCYRDKGKIRESILVFLDTSDTYTDSQRALIASQIFKRVSAASEGTLIVISKFAEDEDTVIQTVERLCVPTESVQDSPLFQRLKKERFEGGVAKALAEADGQTERSPIIEALNDLAVMVPANSEENRMIIVSDLMQHSPLLNMYDLNWLKNKSQAMKRLQKAKPSISNMDLDILFIARKFEDRQTFEVRDWWLTFLSESGANISTFKLISG